MALAAVQSAMHLEKKAVHPFFSKPPRNPSPERTLPLHDSPADPSDGDPDYDRLDTSVQPPKVRKKRTRKADGAKDNEEHGPVQKVQAPLDRFTYPLNLRVGGEGAPSLEEDPNQDRRKRRKTASPPPTATPPTISEPGPQVNNPDWLAQLKVEADKQASEPPKASTDLMVHNTSATEGTASNLLETSIEITAFKIADPVITNSEALGALNEPTNPLDETKKTTPKKRILKVSKNGKLLSPSPTKPELAIALSPKRRRRRATSKIKTSSTAIIIKYGSDVKSRLAIGQKIEDILNGRKPPATLQATTPKVPAKPVGPPKSTHPFFLGKPAPKKDDVSTANPSVETLPPPSPRTQRRSAVTPGKIRAESRMHQTSESMLTFGLLGGNSRAKNNHGLSEPLWPSNENTHVRNIESNETLRGLQSLPPQSHLRARKLKSNIISVPHDEDIIARLSQQLKPCIRKHYEQADTYFEPPEDVRLPNRLLTTGVDIQERVRNEVRALLPHSGERNHRLTGTHPALEALFRDVGHTLTPFDRGTCEGQSWVHKYAPTCASHVLQSGKEAIVLREWLENLTVESVTNNATKAAGISGAKKPLKKKRKKEEYDFIVFSDEEDGGDMAEFSDSEEYGRSEGLPRQKSVKRPRVSRHKNVIVISGPHGCGKSATVYAVAKELGFEVFEINSSSRRSGKDVQDKVGDMSENHLVSNKRNNVPAKPEALSADDRDNERMAEALQKDLESGRQGTMTSFFTSNPQPISKPKVNPKTEKPLKAPTSAQVTLPMAQAPRKLQKQSLILLEEADILFEEDQQFWSQVARLASQSKRPVVITCNNETLIPTYDLPLGAILRLSPPPVDLAADYLLVLAAREGHILNRKTVCDLLHAKDHDLRASITELDFWCQMSVGDRKGGLEWIYQRWPPGKDVDEHGRLLRVASQGTYLSGMGWLSHNVSVSTDNVGFEKDDELLKELWTDWGVSPHNCDDFKRKGDLPILPPQDSFDERSKALKRLDLMSECISAADVYCRVGLPSYEDHCQEPADPSLPSISDKEKSSYTQVAPVIQVDHVSDFASFDTDIFVQSYLSIRRVFGTPHTLQTTAPSADVLTETILQQKHEQWNQQTLSWPDFSEAFDILASPPATTLELSKSYQLTASSFDRTFRIVAEDLAPYVRSIVAYERLHEAERIRMSSLLSEGGTRKRPRNTRASRVAMEGGRRETKRRDRWFDKNLNMTLVMATAGPAWAGLGTMVEESELESRTRESSVSTQLE
ncbi:P-loop containing nucleoside triphosphate hydrolase protein [Melanomma pulvis-pyrius CBS 109.77]|uniref:P-loop containing nucleoside triphosphate hydrolase protein n=1 Tax=Melanomma pulvis-pyrius CBS 109.77 TaxID=1314802 RepID=A0A6A6XDB4_9PLEO|nr:P-loop containing nucleoside triphosphate hydrolase protein [Melanomma pulvis-pyrius CBS 109.77]